MYGNAPLREELTNSTRSDTSTLCTKVQFRVCFLKRSLLKYDISFRKRVKQHHQRAIRQCVRERPVGWRWPNCTIFSFCGEARTSTARLCARFSWKEPHHCNLFIAICVDMDVTVFGRATSMTSELRELEVLQHPPPDAEARRKSTSTHHRNALNNNFVRRIVEKNAQACARRRAMKSTLSGTESSPEMMLLDRRDKHVHHIFSGRLRTHARVPSFNTFFITVLWNITLSEPNQTNYLRN